MGFSSSGGEEGIHEINITPFVDVVLVLLVIFMVTTPLIVKESLKIELPKSTESDGGTPSEVGIGINKDNQVLLNGELISISDLQKALSARPDKEITTALISADKEARHGAIIEVINAIKKAGLDKFAFQIEKLIDE